MRIAVDISPIDKKSESAHKVRGVGRYITLLADNLERFDHTNSYIFTSNTEKLNREIDLIHYPYFDPFFISLPYKKNFRTITTVHDLIPLVHREHFPVGVKGRVKWFINSQLLKQSDAVITDSDASKEDIHAITGIESRKIFPVYLAADPIFQNLKLTQIEKNNFLKKHEVPEEFILYVGDVTWNKNLPLLVDAVKKAKIPLVMVGKALMENSYDKGNPWNSDRRKVIEATRNDSLFIKLGFVANEDLVTLYNSAQLLVMPSIDEGFGLPILEAMQSGCPVVASRGGSIPEVGGNAVEYINYNNPEEIAEKITKIVENPHYRFELKASGLKQSQKFTLENMIKNTVNVYNLLG